MNSINLEDQTMTTKLKQGNCLEIMPQIPSGSVDMILCDYLNSLDWFELGCEDATGRKHFSVGVFERMMLMSITGVDFKG